MTVSMGMLIFAGLAYALEKDEPDTTFYTLPQTLYWAIITMTSTGYGDVAPRTAGGKFIGNSLIKHENSEQVDEYFATTPF